MDRSDKGLLLLLLAALAAAIGLAIGRAHIERDNRAVEIVLDGDDARHVAVAAGVELPALLARLREVGGSALAVREVTIGELVRENRLTAVSGSGRTRMAARGADMSAVLRTALEARLPHARVVAGRLGVDVTVSMAQLDPVPLLLEPDDLLAARSAGLRVVARLYNFPAVSPQAIEAAAAEAESAGAQLVVFREEEALGYDGLLRETAQAFRRHGLQYGFVEMAGQQGDSTLAALLTDRLVRVHSISDSDMLTMSPEVAAARYARAARERNIRACYVRLILRASPDPAATNVRYVKGIADALRAAGFRIGPPAPFAAPDGWPAKWVHLAVAVGLAAGFILLLRRFVPVPAVPAWLAFAAIIAAVPALDRLAPRLVAPMGGLAAAVIFPTLGTVWALQMARGIGTRVSAGKAVGAALLALAAASLISGIGAMLIVGLYSWVGYLSGVGQFSGVKLAYLVPLALIAGAVIMELPGRPEPISLWWTRLRLRMGQFFSRPVVVIEAIVVLAAFAGIAFALTRTGNQPVLAPSTTEIKLRGLLESLLAIRPRTKELLLGHPALMLAVALALRNRRAWLPLVALLAGVGQVSLVNTFCHFHTPLVVSLLRTGHGLWIGALIGVAVILVWRLLFDHPPREVTQ